MKLLIALGLGVAAYLLTRQLLAGLLVAAASFWFLGRSGPQQRYKRGYNGASTPDLDLPERGLRGDEGIAVLCKQVTPERQEWVSVKTGRLFDVLSPDGPPDAKPGDHGEVIFRGARYLVRVPAATRR